jgi:hypothetical protein
MLFVQKKKKKEALKPGDVHRDHIGAADLCFENWDGDRFYLFFFSSIEFKLGRVKK